MVFTIVRGWRRRVAVAACAAGLTLGASAGLQTTALARAEPQPPAQPHTTAPAKSRVFQKFPPPSMPRGAPAETLDLDPNPVFDEAEYVNDMRLTFGALNTYWTAALPPLGRRFTPPSRFFQYEANDTSIPKAGTCNGKALGLNNAFYCPPDDAIHWHGQFVRDLHRTFGDFGAAFVWAHEYAHAMQGRLGRLGNRFTIQTELEADCLAGAWSSWAEQTARIIEPGDIDEALAVMFNSRDKVGTPWFDPQAHGSAQDRIRAFTNGYDQRVPKACLGQ